MVQRTPTYCTVEDVAETLDLPDPIDPNKTLMFSNISHPTYARVEKMILAAEDEIDRRTRRSWRVNYVKDQKIRDIPNYQWDENGWREAYYQNGGYVVQLHKDILPWDPEKGDKIEIRNYSVQWRDISNEYAEDNPGRGIERFWFDYARGRLFLKIRPFQPKFNALRISYRWGAEPDDDGDTGMPMAINRLATLIVASNIITMDMHSIKVGIGGDISGLRDQLLSRWKDECDRIYSEYQRSGAVFSMLR